MYDLIFVDRRDLSHPTPAMRETDAGHSGAKMLEAATAIRAFTAIRERHDRNSVTLAHRRDIGAGRETSPANSWPRICGFVAPVSGCGSTAVTIGPATYS